MSSASPMAHLPSTRRLRHPAEIPFFVLMVVLNIATIAFILRAAVVVPFLPEDCRTLVWQPPSGPP